MKLWMEVVNKIYIREGEGWVRLLVGLTVLHCTDSTRMHCTALWKAVIYLTVVHCTALWKAVIYLTVMHCTALNCTQSDILNVSYVPQVKKIT